MESTEFSLERYLELFAELNQMAHYLTEANIKHFTFVLYGGIMEWTGDEDEQEVERGKIADAD